MYYYWQTQHDYLGYFIKPEQYNQRDARDATNILYANSVGGIFVSFAAAFGLVFVFPNEQIQHYKLAWFAVMCCLLSLRLFDWYIWKSRMYGSAFDPVTVTRRFVGGAMLTAAVWSSFSFLFSAMGVIELASTVIILALVASGASAVLSANKLLSIFFAFVVLVPASTILTLAEEEFQNMLGYLGLIFCVMMIISSRKASAFTSQAIKINNENADLLTQMEAEKRAVYEANNNLEEKVKHRTEKIYELSNIDPLTGLFNRTAFLSDLDVFFAEAVKNKCSIALLFVDLDGFKQINDSLGHSIGDEILRLTAGRIVNAVGNKQKICRWGGDEFLIALPEHGPEQAEQFANALITCLSEPLHFDHNQLSVSATIGIAMFPEHTDNAEEMVRLADTAMYVQKKANKSTVRMFSQEMKEAVRREQRLRDGLTLAVGNKQLDIHYQPVVDTISGKTIAYEALLRWNFQGEPVSPTEFIPIAEQYGIINKIGSWVLERACQDISQTFADSDCCVSVNVSVIQLMQPNFLSVLNYALSESELSASRVFLEITESVFAEDLSLLKYQVEQIQALGVRVSIDDFGTGFSSLSHIQNLGVDAVKIDKSFIWDIDEGGEAIIQATLHIARQLGCNVIAEGIETEQHYLRLKELGVKYMQGYYFAKPKALTAISLSNTVK